MYFSLFLQINACLAAKARKYSREGAEREKRQKAENGFCGQKRVEKVSQKTQNITLSRAIKLHESERARWKTGEESAACDQDGTCMKKKKKKKKRDH